MLVRSYYVYITTNRNKTVLYTGVTNDVDKRLDEHLNDALHSGKHFTGKTQSFYLLYYEIYDQVTDAIAREKKRKLT
jgi:putative endonuclease